ncbi:MAG TPA: competence/damage-inducible protein A [Thermoanaerobaculia bacterium]|nr:competence/damage-inducible protein A [Thermoanaerobaculia bacterium]
MKASIVAVGSELLGTSRTDTNSLWLAGKLDEAGIEIARKTCVGDDLAAIAAELREAARRAPIVLVTGGLGPTADDLTREAVAEFAGRSLAIDPRILEDIRGRFARRGIAMPRINEKQALVVEGSRPLTNPRGSAPGIWLEREEGIVACLPGVPSEMKRMFEELVLPEIARRFGGSPRHRRILKIAAMGESAVEERVTPVYEKWSGHAFTILASVGEVQLHLAAPGTAGEAERVLDEQTADFQRALEGRIYGRDDQTLESVVGGRLREIGATVATAESCTGGLIAQRITDVAGASDYFRGSVVAYADDVKTSLLDVRPGTLAAHGAVSEETAREMAEGARARFGADFALAATGIAGPGGGSPEKPVGTVWIALATPSGKTRARHLRPPGDRATIRGWTAAAALEMLREAIAAPENP